MLLIYFIAEGPATKKLKQGVSNGIYQNLETIC